MVWKAYLGTRPAFQFEKVCIFSHKTIQSISAAASDKNLFGLFCSSFDREALGKISEKQFVSLLKSKDDIPDEDIQEMLEEYYRIAKLKGISTDKPDPPSDSSDEEDDEEGGANPPPPPPPAPPIVKSPPTAKRAGGPAKNSSIKSPTKSQTASVPEDEKWIDYRGNYLINYLITNT